MKYFLNRTNNLLLNLFIFIILSGITACSLFTRTSESPGGYWNELARYLAGMELHKNSKFRSRQAYSFYSGYSVTINRYWERLEEKTLHSMKPWVKKYIGRKIHNPVLYPLSGPDIINPLTIFPGAPRYVMISMEDPGAIPDPLKMSQQELENSLLSIVPVLYTTAELNYFKSESMREHLGMKSLNSIVSIMLINMARMGLSIDSVKSIYLDSNGVLQEKSRMSGPGVINKIPGLKIDFHRGSSPLKQSIIYLKIELKGNMPDNKSPGGLYLGRLRKVNTLLKSAVYLFHKREFRPLAMHLLSISDTLVQDDSGIPYNMLSRKKWGIHLFGNYILPDFIRDLETPPIQELLKNDFRLKRKNLPFPFGYGVWRGKGMSNLLLGFKKK